MTKKLDRIVVVGGGSAGWMSASTFAGFYPEKQITVIESPDIPIIGVGESTIGGIKQWMNALGIKEEEFMKDTDASYKLSIKFRNFYSTEDKGFHYPFGLPFLGHMGPEVRVPAEEILKIWQIKKRFYPEIDIQEYARIYYSQMALIENNKFSKNEKNLLDSFYPQTDVAFHFDAVKFGQWLKEKYCKPRGVKLINANVIEVKTDENGVSELILDNGQSITGDLFIDCTGWKSMLLGDALKEPFQSMSDMLPNNKAWATRIPYTDKEKEMEPFTNCTAINNGWVWNIPLWSRIGTGYVYSDKYISDDEALQEFKDYLNSDKMTIHNPNRVTDELEFKNIKMRIGIHERIWVKNVVAIGLSAGFIEPLESNGLFTTHEFLLKLMDAISRGAMSQFDRDMYNAVTYRSFKSFAQFVAIHYALSHRDDTKYWEDINNRTFDKNIMDGRFQPTSEYFELIRSTYLNQGYFRSHGGMHAVATGLNIVAAGLNHTFPDPITGELFLKEVVDKFTEESEKIQKKWQFVADQSPTLYQYLKDFYNED